MAKIIRPRGDIKTNWESVNPILRLQEIAFEWEDTIGIGKVKAKVGNGVTHWNELDYAILPNESGILYNTKLGWETENPILKIGEMGIEWGETIGVGQISVKLGDGTTHWIDLDYGISNDISNKIITTISSPPESDENPILFNGDTISEVAGKLNKQHDFLKIKLGYERLNTLIETLGELDTNDFVGVMTKLNAIKLNKSNIYDGRDSTSTDLAASANAVRQNYEAINVLNSNYEDIKRVYYNYTPTPGTVIRGESYLYIDRDNIVHGYISAQTSTTGTSVNMATIPVALRPPQNLLFPLASGNGSTIGRFVELSASNGMLVAAANSATSQVSAYISYKLL